MMPLKFASPPSSKIVHFTHPTDFALTQVLPWLHDVIYERPIIISITRFAQEILFIHFIVFLLKEIYF